MLMVNNLVGFGAGGVLPNDDSYAIANNDTADYLRDPGASENIRAGQSFKIYSAMTLNSVQFEVAKENSSGNPGNIVAELYAASGTYGTSSVGTGSVLATSNALTGSDFAANNTYYTKTFTFASPYSLTAGEYVICLKFQGTAGVLSFYRYKYDASSPSHPGNYCYYRSSWTADSSKDMGFVLA